MAWKTAFGQGPSLPDSAAALNPAEFVAGKLFGSKPTPAPNYAAQINHQSNLAVTNSVLPMLIERAAAAGKPVTWNGETYDFTGQGDAQYQVETARKLAQAILKTRQDLGDDYVAQRLAELELADPDGRAMRRQEWQRILAQADQPVDTSLNEQGQAGILARLNGGLTGGERSQIQQAERGRQVDNGVMLGNAAEAAEAGRVFTAEDDKRRAGQQAALEFLQSDATPDAVRDRKAAQDAANFAAFMAGSNPAAQFSKLSGAAAGAVPFQASFSSRVTPNANPGPGLQQALSLQGGEYALGQATPNPWLTGVGLGLNAAATGVRSGWFNSGAQPFGAQNAASNAAKWTD